jgi:hypothetical protein
MKSRQLARVFLWYAALTICFCLYYSFNFSDFVRMKGDEFVFYFEGMAIITWLFFFIAHFRAGRINIANLLFAPVLLFIASILVTVAFFLIMPLPGTARQTFIVHTIVHLLLSFFFGKYLWQRHLSNLSR